MHATHSGLFAGSQYSYLRRHLPPLQIAFADKDGIPVGAPITSLPETSPPFDGGWISTQVLYQNAAVQQAIGNMSVLQGAFQLQFGYDQAADTDQSDVISFCVANLTMLDSTVVLSTGQNTPKPLHICCVTLASN